MYKRQAHIITLVVLFWIDDSMLDSENQMELEKQVKLIQLKQLELLMVKLCQAILH